MQYGLELVFAKNSHVFVEEYLKKPEFVDLMRRLGALGDGKDDNSKFQLTVCSFLHIWQYGKLHFIRSLILPV